MKKYIKNKAFTLIEVIVSVSIMSLIMVSVFSIFALAWDLNNKIDVTRLMQENIKNITEKIAEDVRKKWLNICDSWSYCYNFWSDNYLTLDEIYINWWYQYYLAEKNNSWDWIKQENSHCSDLANNCSLVFNNWTNTNPVSNSWVQFKDFNVYVSKDAQPKITINFTMMPATKKWIKTELIKENTIVFQTSLSERLYNDY